MSVLEDTLALDMALAGIRTPIREYKFHPKRKWRFDFSWPSIHLAVECEGGVWTGGAHNRGKGFSEDCEKYNAAVMLGWRVLRFTVDMIESGQALGMIENALDITSPEMAVKAVRDET